MTEPHLSSAEPVGTGEPEGAASSGDDRVSAPREHAVGDLVAGKYRLVSLLGEGGMGTVWRAHSERLDIDVAIKVLRGEHVASRQCADRLLREAQATARLGHPAIVRVFDFGMTTAGEPFLAMELLRGQSLADWIDERGRIDAAQAVQLLLPIAGGLAAAHAAGIVHRDIKPDNILIVPDGGQRYLPKIVDFGIAKLHERGGGHGPVLTQQGMVIGSLEYMSPEQAEGKQEVGEQTDVWALCVVLYEMIAGCRPFVGKTVASKLFALHTGAPTPTTELAAGDEELWEIIRRGLEKSPAARWPSMLALGEALASWAVERGVSVDAAGTSLAHHWRVDAAAPSGTPSVAPRSSASTPPRGVGTIQLEVAPRDDQFGADLLPPRSSAWRATTDTACVASPLPVVVARPVRRTTVVARGAIVLALAPLVLLVMLYTRAGTDGGAASARGSDATAASSAQNTTERLAPTPASSEAAEPSPPPVAGSPAPPPGVTSAAPVRARPSAVAPLAAPAPRQRRAATAMPLPASPNF